MTFDVEVFRRAVRLRDRCREAAVAASHRLGTPMTPVQANIAFDAMVDLIRRDHDERRTPTTTTGGTLMTVMRKLAWEMVHPLTHPECYHGDYPAVTPDQVPESYWQPVETPPREDVDEQYHGLHNLIAAGELIRNVRMFEADIVEPQWREVRR
jgi:hypothetical protein